MNDAADVDLVRAGLDALERRDGDLLDGNAVLKDTRWSVIDFKPTVGLAQRVRIEWRREILAIFDERIKRFAQIGVLPDPRHLNAERETTALADSSVVRVSITRRKLVHGNGLGAVHETAVAQTAHGKCWENRRNGRTTLVYMDDLFFLDCEIKTISNPKIITNPKIDKV